MGQKNLLLLTGGSSGEHEVSVKSRNYITQFIDTNTYNAIHVLITKDKTWLLESACGKKQECRLINQSGQCLLSVDETNETIEIDTIFPLVLGDGENGELPGLFESLNAPYVGTGVLGSALCFDKITSKHLAIAHGINCVPFDVYEEGATFENACIKLNTNKLFIKPSNSGSTLGASIATNQLEFQTAIYEAQKYDKAVLIEKYLPNVRELFCGVMYDHGKLLLSAIGEAVYEGACFTYELKYGKDNIIVPAEIYQEIVKQIQEQSIQIFKILRCEVFARIDFFLYEGKLYFSEINTIPAMTPTSIFLKLMAGAGYERPYIVNALFDNHRNTKK